MTNMSKDLILSVDVECGGIMMGDTPLAIGAVLYNVTPEFFKHEVIDVYLGRVKDLSCCTEWVDQHVVPAIRPIDNIFESSNALLEDFSKWYLKHKNYSVVIAHIPHPVESSMFLKMRELNLIGEWDQPYPLIDVGAMLHQVGEDPTSTDNYVTKKNICANDKFPQIRELSTHHPLYDACVALSVYLHLQSENRTVQKLSAVFQRMLDGMVQDMKDKP